MSDFSRLNRASEWEQALQRKILLSPDQSYWIHLEVMR